MAYIYIGKNTTKLSNMIGQQNKKNLRSLEKQLVLMAKVEDICVCCFFSSWKYSEAFVLFWYWGESTKNTGNLVLLCISPWYIPVRTPLFKLHSPLMASRLDKSCLEEGNSSKCFEQYTCICRLKHIDTCINIYICRNKRDTYMDKYGNGHILHHTANMMMYIVRTSKLYK